MEGTPPIEHFACGLDKLILRLRDKVCANPRNDVSPADFRVHLVAHSMGGLVCRAFLQNKKLWLRTGPRGGGQAIYLCHATQRYRHANCAQCSRWLSFGDANNFNREKMAQYLNLPKSEDVSVVTNFPAERIFNLVGTNARDYAVAGGLSAWAAGDASDGLVRIENATTHSPGANGWDVASPRAFVNRSHSGPYGVVNSEEGYQNLTRFLFGSLRVDAFLDVDDISLPAEVHTAFTEGKDRQRLLPIRSSGKCARRPVADDASRGTRELGDFSNL